MGCEHGMAECCCAAAVLLLNSSLIEQVVFKVVSMFRFSSCVSSGATFALTAASNPLLPARGGHTQKQQQRSACGIAVVC